MKWVALRVGWITCGIVLSASSALAETAAKPQIVQPEPLSPRSGPPPAPSQPTELRVEFRAPDDTTTLHVWSFNPEFEDPRVRAFQSDEVVCTAPCATHLPRGTYRFGLSGAGRHVKPVKSAFQLNDATILQGKYDDDSGFRIAGWVIIGLAAVVAVAGYTDSQKRPTSPGLGIGLLSLAGGIPLGLVFVLNADNVTLRKSPSP